jgi:hypothetical protein
MLGSECNWLRKIEPFASRGIIAMSFDQGERGQIAGPMITSDFGDRIPLHSQWRPAGGRGLVMALLVSMLLWAVIAAALLYLLDL